MFSILKKTYSQINNVQVYLLITILVFSRLIPHPPNFTPAIAAAILSGVMFRNVYLSILALFLSMFISDALLGFHNTMIYTYFSLFIIVFIFHLNVQRLNLQNTLVCGLIGSMVFFIISNFGVWLSAGLYSKDVNGLIECYYLAIPFFRNTLFSTILYSYIGLLTAIFISQNKLKSE